MYVTKMKSLYIVTICNNNKQLNCKESSFKKNRKHNFVLFTLTYPDVWSKFSNWHKVFWRQDGLARSILFITTTIGISITVASPRCSFAIPESPLTALMTRTAKWGEWPTQKNKNNYIQNDIIFI